MEEIVKILQVVIGLGFIIFVHELGHFLVAKWNNVRCEVFSLGFGPALLKFRPRYPWKPNDETFKYKETLGPDLLRNQRRLQWALTTDPGGTFGNRLRIVDWPVDKLEPGMVRLLESREEPLEDREPYFEPDELTAESIAEIRAAGHTTIPVFDAGETEYRLSVLPLGGYVKMTGGEIHMDGLKSQPDEFLSKKPGPRAAILVAGVTMNIVTGFLMFILAYSIGVEGSPPVAGDPQPVVTTYATADESDDDSDASGDGEALDMNHPGPAWSAGLQQGDRIVQIRTVNMDEVGDSAPEPGPAENDDNALDFTDIRISVAFTGANEALDITYLRPAATPEGEPTREVARVVPLYSPTAGFRVIGAAPLISPVVQSIAANRAEALKGKLEIEDVIVAVNGTELEYAFPLEEGKTDSDSSPWPRSWTHFQQLVREATTEQPDAPINMVVIRNGERIQTEVPTYVAPSRVRLGVDHTPNLPIRGVRTGGPADRAMQAAEATQTEEGHWTLTDPTPFPIRSGDRIVRIEGQEIGSWEQMQRVIRSLPASAATQYVRVTIERPGGNDDGAIASHDVYVQPEFDRASGAAVFQFIPDTRAMDAADSLVVRGLDPDGPAGEATLQSVEGDVPEGYEVQPALLSGDRVLMANDVRVQSWEPSGVEGEESVLAQALSGWKGIENTAPALRLVVERTLPVGDEGAADANSDRTIQLTFSIVPTAYGGDISPRIGFAPKNATILRTAGGLDAIGIGLEKTWTMAQQVFLTLRSLVGGTVAVKNIGGPVMIADASYRFAGFSIGTFIYFMAIISINLAIINILPIPLLDGGHLTFLAIEKIKGSPVSPNVQAIFQWIGLAGLLTMIVFVTINDISRLIG